MHGFGGTLRPDKPLTRLVQISERAQRIESRCNPAAVAERSVTFDREPPILRPPIPKQLQERPQQLIERWSSLPISPRDRARVRGLAVENEIGPFQPDRFAPVFQDSKAAEILGHSLEGRHEIVMEEGLGSVPQLGAIRLPSLFHV